MSDKKNIKIVKAPVLINGKNAKQLFDSCFDTLLKDQGLFIDLSETISITGVGYRIMLRVFTAAKARGLEFCVCKPSKSIENNLIAYNLGDIIAPHLDEKGRSH